MVENIENRNELTPVYAVASPFQSSGKLMFTPEGLSLNEIVEYIFPYSHLEVDANIYIDDE